MRRKLAARLGAAIMMAHIVVIAAEARSYNACERHCWQEERFNRCMRLCLEEPARRPPVEVRVRFPSELIGGGVAGVSLVGLLALILRLIDRATRARRVRRSIRRARRVEELRERLNALAREADSIAEATRRRDT